MYVRERLHGQLHGQGMLTYLYLHGSVCDGSWVENNKHGQGKVTWPNGEVYTGSWQNDK